MEIQKLKARGVHNRFDVDLEFDYGLNILYGLNGAGKTTVLHILANALNRDFERFAWLGFGEITITFFNGASIHLARSASDGNEYIRITDDLNAIASEFVVENAKRERAKTIDDLARQVFRIRQKQEAAYFPAFRSIVEASGSADFAKRNVTYDIERQLRQSTLKLSVSDLAATFLSRELFGQFVPTISFPSPSEIQKKVANELAQALFELGRKDHELLNQFSREVITALLMEPKSQNLMKSEDILTSIRTNLNRLAQHQYEGKSRFHTADWSGLQQVLDQVGGDVQFSNQYGPVLDVYRKILEQRIATQESVFQSTEHYLAAVNEFLIDKQITVSTADTGHDIFRLGLKFPDGSILNGLQSLSSGERQILSLIFAASRMGSTEIVLIDEPEISLHVDWQRLLFNKILDQLGMRQVIACTHSPIMASGYEDQMRRVVFRPVYQLPPLDNEDEEFEEEFL
ncbi:MAG: AAA family ATPase [Fimbriimonas sp.]